MQGALIVVYGMVGLVMGSFLNVVIDRLPIGESLLYPPSCCTACGRELSPLELVPVLSYLALGGRCRMCGASIPPRILLVEMLTGVLFALLYGIYGATLQLFLATAYTCVLLAVTFIDLEHMLIPDILILPATGFALLMMPFWRVPLASGPLSQLVGGLVAFFLFFLIWFISLKAMGVDAMGFGDVKLAAFCGLIVAFPGILVAILGSFILGGLVGAVLLISGMVDRRTPVPFAPFLVVTTFIVMVLAESLLRFFVLL